MFFCSYNFRSVNGMDSSKTAFGPQSGPQSLFRQNADFL